MNEARKIIGFKVEVGRTAQDLREAFNRGRRAGRAAEGEAIE